MSFKKLRIIEAAEVLCDNVDCHGLEPAWTYTGYQSFLNETLARCPAAWRSAVTECILGLNAALPTTGQTAGASRNQCVAQLEFDFSGSCARLQPAREARYNFDRELLPYRNPLRDPVIAGVARKLEVRTRCTCQTCGGRKNPKSPLSRCASCNSVIRTGARLVGNCAISCMKSDTKPFMAVVNRRMDFGSGPTQKRWSDFKNFCSGNISKGDTDDRGRVEETSGGLNSCPPENLPLRQPFQ